MKWNEVQGEIKMCGSVKCCKCGRKDVELGEAMMGQSRKNYLVAVRNDQGMPTDAICKECQAKVAA